MRILKMGQVGGGIGAFIGEVHRKAARLDGGIVLTAGAFDVVPEKSLEQGKNLGVDPKRVYSTYQEMIAGELALPKEERVDFISVCTPNPTPAEKSSPLGRPTMARRELAVELVSLDHRPAERLRIVPPAPTA